MTHFPTLRPPVPRVAPKWDIGRCAVHGCSMTMTTPIGGGQCLCWLHVLLFGLPVEAPELTALSPNSERELHDARRLR